MSLSNTRTSSPTRDRASSPARERAEQPQFEHEVVDTDTEVRTTRGRNRSPKKSPKDSTELLKVPKSVESVDSSSAEIPISTPVQPAHRYDTNNPTNNQLSPPHALTFSGRSNLNDESSVQKRLVQRDNKSYSK